MKNVKHLEKDQKFVLSLSEVGNSHAGSDETLDWKLKLSQSLYKHVLLLFIQMSFRAIIESKV